MYARTSRAKRGDAFNRSTSNARVNVNGSTEIDQQARRFDSEIRTKGGSVSMSQVASSSLPSAE